MPVVYQIWSVQQNRDKDPGLSYVVFDKEKRTWAYPLIEVLSVLSRTEREDIRSLDLDRLKEHCDYLNEIADDDMSYDIREVLIESHLD